MKDTFHWHSYIYCPLNKIYYYSFILRFENTVFILSARTNAQYNSSSFFSSPARSVRKLISLLPVRPGPLEKASLICWPGSLEKSPFIRRPGPVPWKNHLLYIGPTLRPGRYGPQAKHGPVQTSMVGNASLLTNFDWIWLSRISNERFIPIWFQRTEIPLCTAYMKCKQKKKILIILKKGVKKRKRKLQLGRKYKRVFLHFFFLLLTFYSVNS